MKCRSCVLSLLFVLSSSIISAAQSVNYLTDYYPHINKAESFLIEYDYADALVHYDSAFVNVERGFRKIISMPLFVPRIWVKPIKLLFTF